VAALAALKVDTLSVPVNRYAAARQALAALSPAALAELRPLLLRQRTAAGVRAFLQEWQTAGKTPKSPVRRGAVLP
jgi:hypothetical protein